MLKKRSALTGKRQDKNTRICSNLTSISTHLGPVGCLHSPDLNKNEIDNMKIYMKQKNSCFRSKDIDFQQFRQMQMSQNVTKCHKRVTTGEICAEVQGCPDWHFVFVHCHGLTTLSTFVYTQALAVQGSARQCKALQGTSNTYQN